MTLFAIFDARSGSFAPPRAVPEAFSWGAALATPIVLPLHGLWLESLAWLVAIVGLVLVAPAIGGTAAFWLLLLLQTCLGLSAASLRRSALRRRGWQHRGDYFAYSAEQARLEAMR